MALTAKQEDYKEMAARVFPYVDAGQRGITPPAPLEGNGAKATKKRNVKDAWTKTLEAIGSQRHSALLLLNVFKASPSLMPDLSKLEEIREVAYG